MARNEVRVVITGDADRLKGAFGQAGVAAESFQDRMRRIGGNLRDVGRSMTIGITLPIAAAGFAAFKAAQEFDGAYDRIRVGTGATGAALDGLKNDFRAVAAQTPASFEQVSTAIADLNTRLGLTGKPLQLVSRQVLELSRLTGEDLGPTIAGVTRVMGDWGKTGAGINKGLDTLWKVSQATGISVGSLSEQLVKFGAPLRQMGFDFETSAALIGKFEKEGVNAELVMGSLRIALGKMARAGEPAIETFNRVVGEIKNAGSTSEANAKALELFGARAGPDMAAAIREGRFEVGSLVASLAGSSESILGAAKDTEDLGEKLRRLSNRMKIAAEPILMELFDALGDVAEQLAPHLEKVARWFEKLSPSTKKWALIGVAALAVMGPLVYLAGVLATVIAAIASPVGLVVAAIAALVAGFVALYAGNGGFRRWVNETVASVRDKLAAAFDWFRAEVLPRLVKAFNWVKDVAIPELVAGFKWLRDNVGPVLAAIGGFIAAWTKFFVDRIRSFVNLMMPFWSATWNAVSAVVQVVWPVIVAIVTAALKVLTGVVKFATAVLNGDWSAAWNTVVSAVRGAWNWIIGVVQGGVNWVIGVLRGATGGIATALNGAWSGLLAAAQAAWGLITGWLSGAPGRILNVFAGAGSWLIGAGRSIMDGLLSGLREAWERVAGWLGGLARKIKDLKGPINKDRILLVQEGRVIMEGFGQGLREGFGGVSGFLSSVAPTVQAQVAATPAAPAAGVTHVHFHGPVSRDAESWIMDVLERARRRAA